MKLGFLKLSADDRACTSSSGGPAGRVIGNPGKDFWVCWLLGILFQSEFAASLVFKGAPPG